MKVLILTADGMEDSEFFYPYYRFLEEGYQVDIAAPAKGTIHGTHGYSCEADMAISDVEPDSYDLLFLPGGQGPEKVRLQPHSLEICTQMLESGKLVCAICHGVQTLISADLVRGRYATCWPGIRDDLMAAGANYEDSEAVVDGNLITSRMPDDLPAFCREIFSAVRKMEPASSAGVR